MMDNASVTGLLASALQRKRDIDRENVKATSRPSSIMASYDGWLVDAVELLLQIELDRR